MTVGAQERSGWPIKCKESKDDIDYETKKYFSRNKYFRQHGQATQHIVKYICNMIEIIKSHLYFRFYVVYVMWLDITYSNIVSMTYCKTEVAPVR